MISRRLYINIIIYVILIVIFSLLFAFLVLNHRSFRYSILCVASLLILCTGLVSYLNRTNRNMRLFFDSVKNDDSSLSFLTGNQNSSLAELNASMNKVNRQIQQLKIQNRNQEEYFRKTLEHLGTGIITYDKKGFVHNANTAARNLLELETLTHIRQLERVDDKLFITIRSLKPFERKLVSYATTHGETQLSLKTTSFGRDENELIILSIQDIQHELDEKEIDSWMKLIRVLMHEIMNSITPIMSLSESLSKILGSNDKTENTIDTTLQGLKVISDQSRGLMSFVESYRKLTRIPPPEKKPVTVKSIFERVRILSEALENPAGTRIIFDNNNDNSEIYADENLVSLVLINLIKNAIEANEGNDEGLVKIWSTEKDNIHEINVSDNGPGIDENNLDKIFIPFFTTRPNGTGIGLSLSKQIIRAHGGTLKARSVPGKDTVFCITFRS
jgi:nitrogen fixation/metabolism regulation signal transduction histidine kinase